MGRTPTICGSLGLALLLMLPVSGQAATTSDSGPRAVTFCDLAESPDSYNGVLVRITGFMTHGFEESGFSDPGCGPTPRNFSIWIDYGNGAKTLKVEGIEIPLTEDAVFRSFLELVLRERDTTVHATVVGRFFAGKKTDAKGENSLRGYGHMGCCSLLGLQQIESFAPHSRSDLDYTAEAGWYENGRSEAESCKSGGYGYRKHVSLTWDRARLQDTIAQQKEADSGSADWRFTDPRQVAIESLKPYSDNLTPLPELVKDTTARKVFSWRAGSRSWVVVVIRPYWLSTYAKTESVAWIATTIRETQCIKNTVH